MSKSLWWFVPILFLMTVDYRVELGPLSVAIVEPFVLLVAVIVLAPKVIRREPLIWRDPLFLLFAGMTLWAILVRPFSPDWKHGLSDIRDWLLPAVLLFTLINVTPRPARAWLAGFVGVTLLNSAIGILQHVVDNDALRPFIHPGTIYKGTLSGGRDAPFGVAFFDAPNGFGIYLVVGIAFMYGWLRQSGHRFGVARYLLLLIPVYALYSSYSRTSLIIFAIVVVVLLLERLFRSASRFVTSVAALLALGAAGAVVALNFLPNVAVRTFWWRVALWEIAGITLRDFPSVWFFGNGMDSFIPISFYPQPHNLYVFMLLEYGLAGIVFTLAVLGWLLYSGLRARKAGYFDSHPALAPLWIGVLSLFLIGMTETVWLAINTRLLFVTFATLYLSMLAEASPALGNEARWSAVPVREPYVELNTERQV